MTTTPRLVERVVDALGALAELGESIQDEWTYVHDLHAVWVARIRAVALGHAGPGADSAASPELEAAIDRLVDEAERISDPHRAIDWLSTLPQATLVALGEAAW